MNTATDPRTKFSIQQNAWLAQYEALKDAESSAAAIARARRTAGNVSEQSPLGNFPTPEARRAYEDAANAHLQAVANINYFLVVMPRMLQTMQNAYQGIMDDPKSTFFEVQMARRQRDLLNATLGEFSDLSAQQGWKIEPVVEYPIGRYIRSVAGHQIQEHANPAAGAIGQALALGERLKNLFVEDFNNSARWLRENEIDIVDYDLCKLAVSFVKGQALKGLLPAPVDFSNSPTLPFDWKTVGERIWNKGVSSAVSVEENTCRLWLDRNDLRQFLRQYGALDDSDFLATLDQLPAGQVSLIMPREVLLASLADSAALDAMSRAQTPQDAAALAQAREEAVARMQTDAGLVAEFTQTRMSGALAGIDAQQFGSVDYARIGANELSLSMNIDGRALDVHAALDWPVDEASPTLTLQSFNGRPLESLIAAGTSDDLAALVASLVLVPQADMDRFTFMFLADLSANVVGSSTGPVAQLNVARNPDTGNVLKSVTFNSGDSLSLAHDAQNRLVSLVERQDRGGGESVETEYRLDSIGVGTVYSTTYEEPTSSGGTKRYIQYEDGTVSTFTYDASGNIISARQETSALANLFKPLDRDTNKTLEDIAGILNIVNTLKSTSPASIKLASGAVLLNNLSGGRLPVLNTASQISSSLISLYGLANAWKYGDGLAKTQATLNTLNTFNSMVLNSTDVAVQEMGSKALSDVLNGSGLANGAPGVLPAIGLIQSIRSGDAVGIATNMLALYNPALMSTPAGWALVAFSIARSLFAEGPPDAWGVARVNFGPGITNYMSQVTADGESFGPDRARAQLQGTLDTLNQIIASNNQSAANSAQWLGLIPQRMPTLTYRASEFGEGQGYSIKDIDPLSGEQRNAFLKFDDAGNLSNVDPALITPEVRAMLSVTGAPGMPALNAYLLNAALTRQALAPMWEVQTARLQQEAGDPNAGLTEEERAAKAGLAAMIDSAYATSHASDPNAKNRRIGSFMPVGIDLDHDGTITTSTIAGNQGSISFDWDGQGYQKRTGWISANDGFLVLDRDFNTSVDNATEVLSNPLVADAAKGLRSLVAFDANADGRIDSLDPVYAQLRIWQDLNQDGNNLDAITLGRTQYPTQDDTNGVLELRSLSDWGIGAIDYANGRYEYSANGSVQYARAQTLTLEAEQEGIRYTPVGAGIRIEASNGVPGILITEIDSEAAVYDEFLLRVGGETIGADPARPLYEDGEPGPFDPNTQGGPRTITIKANGDGGTVGLLNNDTWHGGVGGAAGLTISAVRNASHVQGLKLNAQGDVELQLQANHAGAASFDYDITSPDGQVNTARVNLQIRAAVSILAGVEFMNAWCKDLKSHLLGGCL